MKVYHISLNEYRHYAASWEFFTSIEDVKEWVLNEIKKFADFIEVDGKDIYELIDEYNESNEKYGIILTEGEIDLSK